MSNFNLPRNPADFRPPSLRAEDGANLFADAEPAIEATADENVYAAPTDAGGPAYRVTGYETTIPHQGGLVLGLGITGLVMLALGVICIVIFGFTEGIEAAIIVSPVLILNLIFTLPPWIMSWRDTKAMEAGAMHSDGAKRTKLGGWLGILATFLTLFLGLPALVVAVYWTWLEITNAM